LTAELAIDTILYVSKKKNIFLGMDELMKSGGDNPRFLVHKLGSLLNLRENFVTLVTTLDQGFKFFFEFINMNRTF